MKTEKLNDELEIPQVCEIPEVHENVVEVVKGQMPAENTLNLLADFFKVFGDGTRVKILWALSVSELCVCDIAEVLGMTMSAVSHQLRILKHSRLVRYRKEGKNVFYSLDDNHILSIFKTGLEHINE